MSEIPDFLSGKTLAKFVGVRASMVPLVHAAAFNSVKEEPCCRLCELAASPQSEDDGGDCMV